MIDVGIVIVNWNTVDELERCLETVYASQGDFSYHVVVVDNASTDNSAEIIRQQLPLADVLASDENLAVRFWNAGLATMEKNLAEQVLEVSGLEVL